MRPYLHSRPPRFLLSRGFWGRVGRCFLRSADLLWRRVAAHYSGHFPQSAVAVTSEPPAQPSSLALSGCRTLARYMCLGRSQYSFVSSLPAFLVVVHW